VTVQLIRPEITKAEWHDADGNSAGKGLVGDTLKLHAETKDLAEGAGVRFAVYNSATREKVAEPDVTMNGTTAEAEWTAAENREPGDKRELRYFFKATAPRAQTVKSSDIPVKNPQVVSMEWKDTIVYYGEEMKLTVKTFEAAELSPSCKLQLWEKDVTTEDDFILEQDITLDKDEVEVTIKTDFDIEKLLESDEGSELEVYAKIVCDTMQIKQGTTEMLIVKLGDPVL
jgi:hypothetical protein